MVRTLTDEELKEWYYPSNIWSDTEESEEENSVGEPSSAENQEFDQELEQRAHHSERSKSPDLDSANADGPAHRPVVEWPYSYPEEEESEVDQPLREEEKSVEDSALDSDHEEEYDSCEREEWAKRKTWDFVEIIKKRQSVPEGEHTNLHLKKIARWFFKVWTEGVSWKRLRDSEEEEVNSKSSDYQGLFKKRRLN